MPFIIYSVILSLQLDRDIWKYMNIMALRAQGILRHPKLSDIATQHTRLW